jgi:Laminin G domain.
VVFFFSRWIFTKSRENSSVWFTSIFKNLEITYTYVFSTEVWFTFLPFISVLGKHEIPNEFRKVKKTSPLFYALRIAYSPTYTAFIQIRRKSKPESTLFVIIPMFFPLRFKVSLRLNPRDVRDGIILYSGQSDDGLGDFISLAIREKHMEFRFDTGSGTENYLRFIKCDNHIYVFFPTSLQLA